MMIMMKTMMTIITLTSIMIIKTPTFICYRLIQQTFIEKTYPYDYILSLR